jgi:hypothetical protein
VAGLVGLAVPLKTKVTPPLLPILTVEGTVIVIVRPDTTTEEAAVPLTVTLEAVGLAGSVVPLGKVREIVLVPASKAPWLPTLKETV